LTRASLTRSGFSRMNLKSSMMMFTSLKQKASHLRIRKGREASAFRGATFLRRRLTEAASVGVVTPGAITGASGSG
jgi:hypothetical protein